MTVTARQWILHQRPVGEDYESALSLEQRELGDPAPGQVLVEVHRLSLDPANRIWMAGDSYRPAVPTGGPMEGLIGGRVIESADDALAPGDWVTGMGHWGDHCLVNARELRKVPVSDALPLEAFLSILGITGLTAYYGLIELAQPQAGETVVVSAAAGAVGSAVGQLAKIHGCRTVGIAGSRAKCDWLRDELGFDAAIDYKQEDVRQALRTHCPDGIDIYFDNVGGAILEAALDNLADFARIPVCGMISGYNATERQPGPANLANLIMRRAWMHGFVVIDYLPRAETAVQRMGEWLSQGKLSYRVHGVDGLENTLDAFHQLFHGGNVGKLLVNVAGD